ncbi:hypothetical protein Tco_0433477, partial [Tanacetum coccineum]
MIVSSDDEGLGDQEDGNNDDNEMFNTSVLDSEEVFVAELKVVAKAMDLSVDEVTLAQALAASRSVKPNVKEPSVPVSSASIKVSVVSAATTVSAASAKVSTATTTTVAT